MKSGITATSCKAPYRAAFARAIVLCVLITGLAGSANANVNVRTNPVYVVVGAVNIDIDIGLGERWTLGPTLTIDALLEDAIYGARLNRYRQPRDANGWYTGLDVRYSPTGLGNGEEFISGRVLEHYQWQWDNFNLALGIGPDLRQQGGDWALWPVVNTSLGWRF